MYYIKNISIVKSVIEILIIIGFLAIQTIESKIGYAFSMAFLIIFSFIFYIVQIKLTEHMNPIIGNTLLTLPLNVIARRIEEKQNVYNYTDFNNLMKASEKLQSLKKELKMLEKSNLSEEIEELKSYKSKLKRTIKESEQNIVSLYNSIVKNIPIIFYSRERRKLKEYEEKILSLLSIQLKNREDFVQMTKEDMNNKLTPLIDSIKRIYGLKDVEPIVVCFTDNYFSDENIAYFKKIDLGS